MGSIPDPAGELTGLPIPLVGFKGPTSRRREKQKGEGRGWERKGTGEGESGGKGRCYHNNWGYVE